MYEDLARILAVVRYETNYLVDTAHAVILDVEATPARLSQDIVARQAHAAANPRPAGANATTLGR